MKTNFYLLDDKRQKIPTRTVSHDVERLGWTVVCAWCRIGTLEGQSAEVVQTGFKLDLITTLCYCARCAKCTAVKWECAAERGERV